MKKLLLSGLVFAAMSSAALAAEPLTEQQMDNVTAGVLVQGPYVAVRLNGTLDSRNGLSVSFRTESFFVVGNSP
jgi:hypothetical protein